MPRGGKRQGAGRPPGEATVAITVRISPDNADWLKGQGNQSKTVDGLIGKAKINQTMEEAKMAKPKTTRKTFTFRSTWSNHSEGQDYREWDNGEAPPEKYYSDIYQNYLPHDAEDQKPNSNGYLTYPDGAKVRIEEFGNTSAPYGTYIKKVHMIFPIINKEQP